MTLYRGSRSIHRRGLAALTVASLLMSTVLTTNPLHARSEDRQRADDLLPVDCLLPGAVRKLGGRHTYLTARRPVKTTAVDCEIRGGEYVHYDRADYRTALSIWLPMAEEGDARAQNYVGEIYEKGLGAAPDYDLAARWYKEAADQDYAPAQVNLGHLHELGRGVDHSMDTAIDLYRQAAGIRDKQLMFVSWDYSDEKYEQLTNQVASQAEVLSQQQRKIEKLTYQLDASQEREETLAAEIDNARSGYREELQALELAKATVAQQQARLSELERQAAQPRPKPGPSEAQYQELESQKADLAAKSSALAGLEAALQKQQMALRQQAVALEKKATALESNHERTAQVDAELAAAREAIALQSQGLKEQASAMAAQRQMLEDQSRALDEKAAALDAQRQALAARENRIDNKQEMAAALSQSVETQRLEVEKAHAEVARRENELAQRESTLFKKSSELRKLNEELAALRQQLTENANAFAGGTSEDKAEVAQNKPVIEMIEPQLLVTRGDRLIVKTRAGLDQRTIIGRVLSGNPIRELLINDRNARLDERGIFQQRIPILGKETPVSIVAVDRSGLRSDLNFVLGIEDVPETNLYTTDADAGMPKSSFNKVPKLNYGKYHALLIGNKDYQMLPSLDTTVTDATAFRDVLRDQYGFSTTLLTNATRYDILSALEKLRQELTDEDNLLIYYAGHGELDEVNTRGHWLPVDAEEHSRANWISNVAISDILNSMSANKVLVVADSCYSGSMTRSTLARLDAGRSQQAWKSWLKKLSTSHSRLIFSSGGVAPVLDGGGGQHSIFAKALLDVLRSNDGVLEGRQVHAQVAQAVNYAAQAAQFDQTPLYAPIKFAGHEGGDFLFVAQAH